MTPFLDVTHTTWQLYLVEANKDGIFVLKFDSQSTDYDHLLSYANYQTRHGATTYIIPAPGDPNAKE